MKNDNNDLIRYCLKYSTDLSQHEEDVYKRTQLKAYNPAMSSSPIQARLLKLVSMMLQPKHILEVGTFTGFATLCLAEGLAERGVITTIEFDEENHSLAQAHFLDSQYKNQIRSLLGNAVSVIPTLEDTFDLVFIDAAKKLYIDFYELVMDKVRPGGCILVDNVLWFEKILDEKKDPTTQAIHSFNEHVKNDPRVVQMILPFEDGLQLIVKK